MSDTELVDYITLYDALAIVRVANMYAAEAGWHLGLAGSCLHRGVSSKDVDVVAFPLKKPGAGVRDLQRALRSAGWWQVRNAAWMRANFRRRYAVPDTKHVEVWGCQRDPVRRDLVTRVDLIVVR